MSQKRTRQIEQRIDRIKQALQEIGAMRPGSLTRQYKDHTAPHRGLLADQLYPPDEEPHRVRRQESVKEIRRQIATHKRFNRLVD
jgi:hypothetical protein